MGAGAFLEADVVLDTGGDTIIVTRHNRSRSTKRVPRDAVNVVSDTEPLPSSPTSALPDALRTSAGEIVSNRRSFTPADVRPPKALHCVETGRGWCALQRQASPPTKVEMVCGAYTICSTWTSSRSAPTKREPTCDECRARIGYDAT